MGNALGCIQVKQSSVAMKETFGKFDEVLTPGCHCMPWCLGSQVGGYLSLRLQQLDVRCQTKTKDDVFVTVVASVQYRALADKAVDAYYQLSNTREYIQTYVFDVIRASVPMIELDSVFVKKSDIAKSLEAELRKAMFMYGYEIVETLIVDIEPEECVKKSMNEFNAASRAYAARSEAKSRAYYGHGIAWECENIVKGLEKSGFSSDKEPGTSAKDIMEMILLTQYFQTLEKVAASSNSTTVFIPHGPPLAIKDYATQNIRCPSN